ncbi:MAG: protein kinase [Actinomycetota bacterium]|nr:protein kinase [Actinomycetota bacterium]
MAVPADLDRDGVTPPNGFKAVDRCPHCGASVQDAWLLCAACGHPVAAAAELPAGTRLGQERFEVLGVVGRGGFGITYDVFDHRLRRRVAIKELFPESAVRHGETVLTAPQARPAFREARSRFLREARVLARFTHAGIVRVYEVFEEHNSAYLVMELLEGRTLLDLLRERGRPFSEAEVLDVAARAAIALRPVHVAGVLHRDINPANIVLTDHGRIVVIDFGIARSFESGQSTPMTAVVTPGYAPLEQYVGNGRFGPASDVYGLAATLYRLATAEVPVGALEREGGKALPAPHVLNPAISKTVSDAIVDGLELNPDHRPQTLDAFLLRLGLRVSDPRPPRSVLLEAAPPHDGQANTTEQPRRSPSPGATVLEPGLSDRHVWSGRPEDATVLESARSRSGPEGATALVPPTVVGAPDEAVDSSLTRVDRPAPPPHTRSAAAPPSIVGPYAAGRWKATVPLACMALALGAAAPVAAIITLVLIILPLLATWGDSVVHRFRRESGTAQRWIERATPPAAAAPVRFVGNVVVSALRSLPIVALTGALVGLWYGLDRLGVSQTGLDGVLRAIGLLTTTLLVVPARIGSPRFRTGVAIDDAVSRLVTPGGRLGQRGAVLWILAAAAIAGAVWLTPEVWPLPH